MQRIGILGSVLLLLASLGVALAPGAGAAEPTEPTSLTIEAPAAVEGNQTPVTVSLGDASAPLPGAAIVLERRNGDAWEHLADLVTDESGTAVAELTLARDPADNRVRARYDGDETHAATSATYQVPLRRRSSRLRLTGPAKIVDETTVRLTARWRTGSKPVPGEVSLQRRRDGRWHTTATRRTGADGEVSFKVGPREDSRWRAVAPAQPWVERARSAAHRLDNVPPGTPVSLPANAPAPRRKLPPQRRAVGSGANAVISTIPNKVWRQMKGRSWHRGCPVGRAGLRLLRINYWGYDGYRHRGEVVAAAGAVGQMSGALAEMYRRELPIRSMYRVDRFGWSAKLRGADDYASMAAGNTSAFNCREVVGRPGVRSPHAYGRALDVNTWENPYRSPQGVFPNRWWLSHSHPRVAWRSRSHPVVALMSRHGLRWTYGLSDIHHFDAAVRDGRVVLPRGCRERVCH
ncbi:M15 family metallopeptidase [Nocardioides sp. YIM 152588]|uniref:M15 family metallopeptidase n=1 Tax=Nocardioides sp. YIM 152588 TaxID=3158259 RepID=UPI0032E4EF7C